MIAYHFPPVRVSSGIQRTLKFATYLRDYGWEPIILTVSPQAYPVTSDDQMTEIPPNMYVKRAWAIDAKKHLSLRGRYLKFTALPDRYASWLIGGVWAGRRLIKQFSPQVIWSTYPIATAHNIGFALHQWSGLPWVADFRDSMTEEGYPEDPVQRRYYLKIEQRAIRHSSRCVFTAPGAVKMYQTRYPDLSRERFVLIHNGYDENNFTSAEQFAEKHPRLDTDKILLVHSGVLYPQERDPRAFFHVIRELKRNREISSGTLEVRLRATGHDEFYRSMLARFGIADIVSLKAGIPYINALAEMLQADGLLLFQSDGCNHQIPAKLYEYLRAGCPVLGLTDRHGDTSRTLQEMGHRIIVPLNDRDAISRGLKQFLRILRSRALTQQAKADIERYSRKSSTERLAHLLNQLTD